MPKEMINVTIQRKQGEPWGMVIVGGKDQALTVKLGRIKAYSPAEAAGLKEWDYIWSINGQEVFELAHNQICGIIKSAGTSLQMVVERWEPELGIFYPLISPSLGVTTLCPTSRRSGPATRTRTTSTRGD